MRHIEETVPGAGGDLIQRQAWLPDAQATDAVVIAHGFAEHSGRYQHVAEALVGAGFAELSVAVVKPRVDALATPRTENSRPLLVNRILPSRRVTSTAPVPDDLRKT